MNSARRAVLATCLALLGPGACAIPARAATATAECLAAPSHILHRAVGYCAILPPGYRADKTRRYPVLYLLHGLGENQTMLIRSGLMNLVEDLWDRNETGKFLIVTPEAGSSFYINSLNGRERYEDFFIREFLPFIARRYRIRSGRMNRGIAGLSMGGYGALHLAFRYPQLFGSVAAESAALMEHLPSVTVAGPESHGVRRMLGGVFGSPPDPAFWAKNSPLTLARAARLSGMKIYFDCGEQDGYGFYRGAQALDHIMTARRIPHEFHLYPGGHDWIYFAAHLPDLLRFESNAFGLTRATHR
jgi:S-formylglutathione hydrolase FrmB